MKKIIFGLVVILVTLTSCTDARIASRNLSQAAEMFELDRRIVFYNGITNQYILVIEGRCSVETNKNRLAVTCKTSATGYKKHYLGLSDNVTYFSEQLDPAAVGVYHYRIIFKPAAILPNIDLR